MGITMKKWNTGRGPTPHWLRSPSQPRERVLEGNTGRRLVMLKQTFSEVFEHSFHSSVWIQWFSPNLFVMLMNVGSMR